jgi:hypothetical protein
MPGPGVVKAPFIDAIVAAPSRDLVEQSCTRPAKAVARLPPGKDRSLCRSGCPLRRRGRCGGSRRNAKWRLVKPEQTQDDVQADALGELFHCAFRAACDQVAVSICQYGIEQKYGVAHPLVAQGQR